MTYFDKLTGYVVSFALLKDRPLGPTQHAVILSPRNGGEESQHQCSFCETLHPACAGFRVTGRKESAITQLYHHIYENEHLGLF